MKSHSVWCSYYTAQNPQAIIPSILDIHFCDLRCYQTGGLGHQDEYQFIGSNILHTLYLHKQKSLSTISSQPDMYTMPNQHLDFGNIV